MITGKILDTKWNDYDHEYLYLWNGKTLYRVQEGSGDNLDYEDEEEGYVDYWNTEVDDVDGNGSGGGGIWLETELICDIDYTIAGVIERMKECDLPDGDWEVIDPEIGEEMDVLFRNIFKANIAVHHAHYDLDNFIKNNGLNR